MLREIVTMEGHLIDSDILRRAFARIVEEGGGFEVLEFRVGKTNDEQVSPAGSLKDAVLSWSD